MGYWPFTADITARSVFTEIKKNNIANLTHLEKQLWLLFVQNLLEKEFLTIQKSNCRNYNAVERAILGKF
jgi:hypothetical protein